MQIIQNVDKVELFSAVSYPLRDRDTGRSHVARTGILGQDCVLLQARDHEEAKKRSRDAANGEPWTLGLETKRDRRAKLRMSMWL